MNPLLTVLLASWLAGLTAAVGGLFGWWLPSGDSGDRSAFNHGVLAALLLTSLLGPMAAGAGFLLLQGKPQVTGGIMCFAAGGILYLIFEDIAPQSRLDKHGAPPLGAVLGFAVGMAGNKLLL